MIDRVCHLGIAYGLFCIQRTAQSILHRRLHTQTPRLSHRFLATCHISHTCLYKKSIRATMWHEAEEKTWHQAIGYPKLWKLLSNDAVCNVYYIIHRAIRVYLMSHSSASWCFCALFHFYFILPFSPKHLKHIQWNVDYSSGTGRRRDGD